MSDRPIPKNLEGLEKQLRLYKEELRERGIEVSDSSDSESLASSRQSTSDDKEFEDPYTDIYVPGVIGPFRPRPVDESTGPAYSESAGDNIGLHLGSAVTNRPATISFDSNEINPANLLQNRVNEGKQILHDLTRWKEKHKIKSEEGTSSSDEVPGEVTTEEHTEEPPEDSSYSQSSAPAVQK